jgi:hypothetical protein
VCVVWACGEEYYSWKLYCKILFSVMPVARSGHQNYIHGHDTGYYDHEIMHIPDNVCMQLCDLILCIWYSSQERRPSINNVSSCTSLGIVTTPFTVV